MIEQVLLHWKASLSIFLPSKIKSGLIDVVKNYISVIKNSIITMRWFFLADLFLTAILAEAAAKKITSGVGLTFLVEITNLNWLIIYSAIIILIRKRENPLDAKTYLKSMFLKSINGLFIFMILEFVLFALLLMLGITHVPTIPWVFQFIFQFTLQIFGIFIIFYWLDSNGRFTNFLISVEKAVNLIFYNMPVFLILLGLLFGIRHLLQFFGMGNSIFDFVFLNNSSLQLLQPSNLKFAEFKLIFAKYSKFMFEIFWLCILFLFYSNKRDVFYSKSIFEYEENETD